MAYERIHYLLNKREGDLVFAALKLDMSKAYDDRVRMKFLENMMRRLGFEEVWIQLIMNCVTTVSYRVKVNGELSAISVP